MTWIGSSTNRLCRPPGHHAERDTYGGFCYFCNGAIAAQYLVERLGTETLAHGEMVTGSVSGAAAQAAHALIAADDELPTDPEKHRFTAALDPHTPGDQGPTFHGRTHVPAGETFSRNPQTGPQLQYNPSNP